MNSKQPKSHSFGLLGMEPVNFDEAWIQLESSLLSMLQNVGAGFPNDLWIELVEKVYRVCVGQGESSHLYSKIQEMLLKYNQNKLMELQEFQYSTNHSSLDFLSQYQNAFVNYGTGITFGSHLFSHLDRPWISNNHCDSGRSPMEGVYFVHELALIMWKEVVKSEKIVVFDILAPYICSSILSVINAARGHNVMDLGDGGILQSVVEMYEILGFEKWDRSQLFQEHLDHVIEDTGVYFIRRAMQIIDSMPIGQYMKQAEKILSEEATRNSTFVGPYTAERMFLKAKEGLIFDHSDRLVEEATKTMLVPSHEKRDDLKRLYRLVACTCYSGGDESRLETNVFGRENFGGNRENEVLDKLLQAVMGHIKRSGMEIVQNVQAQGGLLDLQSSRDHGRRKLAAHEVKKQGVDSNIVVDMIINVYEHYSGMVKECFDDSAAFHSTLDDACRVFVNAIPRVAEWLARYAHHLLNKEFKESRIGEDARSFALDRVGFLFGFITDKDIFHMFYANLLRTRITQLTSQSDESEERMLSNLRKASGFEYTSKLQRMFVDKALSRELHTGYMQWQERLVAMMKLHDPHLPKPGRTMTNGEEEEEEQSSSARTIMHTGAAGVNGSALNLSEDVQKASLVGDGHLMPAGDGTISPAPMSPTNMSSSSKGLSPRMNILPSFAWGRTMFRHLRRSPRKSAFQSSEAYFGETCGDGMGDCDLTQNIYGCTNDWGDVMPTFDAFTFVLTAGCWSFQSVKSTFTPPKPIENYIKSFLQFYSESHSGRRLEWLFHLGHGEMYAHGFDKTYCIHSSTFQMGILYQFGHAKRLSVQDIAQSVTIPEKELCRHLYPLIKISWNDITPEHTIVINEKFTSRRILVKIDIVDHSKLSTKEEHSVEEDMAPDRMRSVQAAICRIMKSRKQMEHHSLCAEVQYQLKHLFVPNKAFIKQNVEELISKYYIERVGTEEYKYCS